MAAAAAGLAARRCFSLAADVGGVAGAARGTPAAVEPIKLAVLPFENLTGDPEQEYFSDGLTDEMITQLGRLHPQRLSVIARTSSMRYKNRDAPDRSDRPRARRGLRAWKGARGARGTACASARR